MTRHVVSLLTSLRGDVTRHAGGPGRANRIRRDQGSRSLPRRRPPERGPMTLMSRARRLTVMSESFLVPSESFPGGTLASSQWRRRRRRLWRRLRLRRWMEATTLRTSSSSNAGSELSSEGKKAPSSSDGDQSSARSAATTEQLCALLVWLL